MEAFFVSAQAGDTMPFDPNSPFDPTDPTQWWRLRNLPHILVQPNAPPNPTAGGAEDDGLPNDWFVPEHDGYPNDWIDPDNQNAPAPAAAPPGAAPAPSPPPSAANPITSNPSAARFDPYEAFWSHIPASRAGAFAWHPPIFLSPDPASPQNIPVSPWGPSPPFSSNPFGQFPPAASAPPDVGPGGVFGGIGRILAERAKANDPLERLAKNSILGGIPKLLAASEATNPWDSVANGWLPTASAPTTIPSIEPTGGPLAPWPTPFSGPLPPASGLGDQYPWPLPGYLAWPAPASPGQSADTIESQIFDKSGFFPPIPSAAPLATTALASNPFSRFLNALNPINPAFAAEDEGPGFPPAIAQAVAQGLIDLATAKILSGQSTLLHDAWKDLREVAEGRASSPALARALEASGVSRRPGYAAHHIVAGRDDPAKFGRIVLQKFGIGINDAENGVFLPASRATQVIAGETIHSTLHSDKYYDAVNDALEVAKTKQEAIDILARIRRALQAGDYP
jgi:A nuclease family of the HNH/ENDO VII superfamily with conserved AHH